MSTKVVMEIKKEEFLYFCLFCCFLSFIIITIYRVFVSAVGTFIFQFITIANIFL